MKRVGSIMILAGVIAALPAASASAATVSVGGRSPNHVELEFRAAPGEVNRPDIRFLDSLPTLALIRDPGASLRAGFGCVSLTVLAVCGSSTRPIAEAVVVLDDRDDVFQPPTGATVELDVSGGTGTDQLFGGPREDALRGGPGNDRMSGGPFDSADFFLGGTGADDIRGGGGSDSVAYVGGAINDGVDRASVTLILDDIANDGAEGEGDNVHSDVENASGTLTGPNKMVGTDAANRFTGGPFADDLRGGAGPDFFLGDGGPDRLEGGTGADHLSAGEGDDTLHARDGERDDVVCHLGTDTAFADAVDFLGSCEIVGID